jgi:hypothetical protein
MDFVFTGSCYSNTMKTTWLKKAFLIFIPVFFLSFVLHAPVVSWSSNNSITAPALSIALLVMLHRAAQSHPAGNYADRLQMISADGHFTYSSEQVISFTNENGFQLQAINAGNNNLVRFPVNAEKPGNYVFSLYSLNGNRMAVKSARLRVGSQALQMDNILVKAGVCILIGENGNQKISTKIMIL